MFKESDQIEKFEPKVWLSSPTMHGEEFEFLKEAYETNWMSTVGRNIDEVEHQMAEIIGCKYAVGLSAGTAALHLAMKLAGVKKGMKVFCSDLTFDATVNPVIYEGGVPVFIDTEYDTWNMDPVALEKAFELYPDVRVVVVAHLYGTPGKIDEIRAICEKHNALIVEDAAESLGAKYKEVQTGTFGDIGCISFNGNKIITGSSGGMLLTNDLEAAEKAKKWSTQSREDAPWYQHEELGYNYRMSNVIAGVVRGQIPHLEEHIAQKKAIYDRYKEGFKDLPVQMNPYDSEKSEPNFWNKIVEDCSDAGMEEHSRNATVARFKWLYGDLKLMFKDDYDDKESMKTVQCIMRQTGTIGIKSLESKKDKIFASLCIADLNLAKTMYKILNRSK